MTAGHHIYPFTPRIDAQREIHIRPQQAAFPAERVQKVAHALEDPTVSLETIRRRANAPVANVAKSFHDDYIKENAKFRADAGAKKPTILTPAQGRSTAAKASAAAKRKLAEQTRKRLDKSAESGIIETDNEQLLKQAVASGSLPLTINPEKQARHMLAEGELAKPDGRSYLTVDLETAQQIINRYYATGDVTYVPSSSKFKELIETDIMLGIDGRSGTPTNQAFINYSKTGTHLVPTKKGRGKND